jgi:CBS domain-containing protein
MREPAVADVMTRQVITAVPDTPFRELVGTMLAHDLDALPVIDLAGHPIGVVTDIDTLTKLEYHGGADYLPLLASGQCRTRWRKSSGVNATDLMTTPPPTITAAARITTALHALADGARRLFVVDNAGLLAGTLTRHDLLGLLLRDDSAIRADIERTALVPASEVRNVTVEVTDGIVALSGKLRLRSTTESVYRVALCVPGVITVHNDLRYDIDDMLITGL